MWRASVSHHVLQPTVSSAPCGTVTATGPSDPWWRRWTHPHWSGRTHDPFCCRRPWNTQHSNCESSPSSLNLTFQKLNEWINTFFYSNIKKWDLTVKSYVNSCEMFHVNRANLWTEAAGCAVLGWTRVHLTQQITVFLTWRSTFREQEGVLTIWQTRGSM